MKSSEAMNLLLFFGFFVVSVSGGPQVIKCKNLKPMGISEVQNPDCIAEGSTIRVYTRCTFTCPPGYVFKKIKLHTLSRYCNHHGKWTGEDDICIDISPPRFTSCPSQKVLNTAFRSNVAKNVEWKTPTYYDNSVLVEGGQLTLVEKNGYTSPRDFGIGKHSIEYTVTDKCGLEDTCYFAIIVKDIEPPYYTYCPADIHKTYSEDGEFGMRIFWRPAAFEDNSGIDPTVLSSARIGSYFRKGINEVTYTAVDSSGNLNGSCSFQVILKERSCVKRPEPKNGALACFNAGSIKFCNPFCPEGYEFSYKPEDTSICYNGAWRYWSRSRRYQAQRSRRQEWPDCVARQNPSNGNLKMPQAFYYHGHCLNKEVQSQLKSKFHTYLLTRGPGSACLIWERCTPANMEIHCGAMTQAC